MLRPMRRLLFAPLVLVFLVFTAFMLPALADSAVKNHRGQVVCSGCWDEEPDRKKTPYGTPADLECALQCQKRGIAAALAVEEGSSVTLYELGPGAFRPKSWLPYMGQNVIVRGRVEAGKKPRILVDAVKAR